MPSATRFAFVVIPLALAAGVGILGYDGLHRGSDTGGAFQPRQGGTYRMPLVNDPPTFDPALATDATSVTCIIQLFDGLVRCEGTRDPAVAPSIASAWELDGDQRTYTFHLRHDVRFHAVTGDPPHPTVNGGRRVTASDLKYSFERLLDPATKSPRNTIFEPVEGAQAFAEGKAKEVSGLRVVNEWTLQIRLSRPYAPFLVTLTMPNASVVPREDVEALGKNFARNPVGTGAFIFRKYSPNHEVTMDANRAYFDTPPHLDHVVMVVMPDEERRFAAFQAGELDHSQVPDPYYASVKERNSADFTEVSQLGVYYYGMNVQRFPFNNLLVRQAFSRAVDKEAIRHFVKSDRVEVAHAPLPPDLRIHLRGPPPYTYNPHAAGDLLTRAGFPLDAATGTRKGLPAIPIQVQEGDEHMRIARAIQANLADIGVVSYPVCKPFKEHLKTLREGGGMFFRLSWAADYKDPDNFLWYNFHSKNIGSANYSGYSNPQVDQLLDEARETTVPADRRKLYEAAQQIIVDDAPWICLFYSSEAIVHQPNVQGFNLTSFGEHMIRLSEVWFGAPAVQ